MKVYVLSDAYFIELGVYGVFESRDAAVQFAINQADWGDNTVKWDGNTFTVYGNYDEQGNPSYVSVYKLQRFEVK